MAAEEAGLLTTKKKELLLYENRLFRFVGENKNNLNIYYLCNTGSNVQCKGRHIKSDVGITVRSAACIETCHPLSESQIVAIRARK